MATLPRRNGAPMRLCRVLAALALVLHDTAAQRAAPRNEDREVVELKFNFNWNLKSVATLLLGSPPQSTGFEVSGDDMVWLQASRRSTHWWAYKPPPPAPAENWTGYDYTLSTSARIVASNAFADLQGNSGDVWNDTWVVGGATLDDYTFGVEEGDGSNPERVLGMAGLGNTCTMNRTAAMLPLDSSSVLYPSVPAAMAAAGSIPTAAYSLWLGPLGNDTSGSVLFGAIDTAKYRGPLTSIKASDLVLLNTQALGQPPVRSESWGFQLSSVTANSPSGQDVLESGLDPLYVRPAHGLPLIILPIDIATEIWREVGATMDLDLDTVNPVIPCSMRHSAGTLDFRLAGPDGPVVKVPMSELVLPLYLAARTPPEQQWLWLNSVFYDDGLRAETCLFAVGKLFDASRSTAPASPYPAPFSLGDPFLRAAYMVFDVANKEFGVAQSNPRPAASSVVWFDGAAAAMPRATPGPPLREPTAVTQLSATPRPTLAAASGFRILRDPDAPEASPGPDQAGATASPSPNAEAAAASHARHLALGLGVGIPLGLIALALAFLGFWVTVLKRSLPCCGPFPRPKHGDDQTRAELEEKGASSEATEVNGASRVHELSATPGTAARARPSAPCDASRSQAGGPDAAEEVSPVTYQSLSPLGPPSVSP